MKRYILGLLTVFALVLSLTVSAFAADPDYNVDLGTVEYNGTKLVTASSFDDLNAVLSGIEPGSSVLFTVNLKNGSEKETDWWMSNKTVESFEDNTEASGGAYTYILTYNGKELYNSDAVGGEDDQEDGDGLHEATGALEDYFYLDTLKKGGTGTVTLYVALDGLTEHDDYQGALSEIDLSFGVEERGETVVIKTGDTTKIMPYFIGIGVSGVVLLGAVIIYSRKRANAQKGGTKS